MAGQSNSIQQQDTLNRYLLYFPRNKTVLSDVLSFRGEEELSKPYRYTIRFTSPVPDIAVNDVLNQMAEFILRAPNPKAGWHNQEPWLPVRQINGVITSFTRLKSSADETLYECVLEHELALMDRNYRSAVYMGMTVPELVTKLMKDSGHFQGYNIDFDQLGFSYPLREMVIQWKETDLQFIHRLLAEVGIWFRFENHDKVPAETVVIFGDGGRRYVFSDKKLPYVRHSGMTSHEEYVTELEERYQLIPENVLVRTYNYRDPFSPQADKTITDNDIPDGITRGKQYHYADHFLSEGDFYGLEAETATFYARLRYERLLNNQSVLGLTTSDPELLPGVMFNLTGDIPAGFKPGYTDTKRGIHTEPVSQFYQIFSKTYIHPSEKYIAVPTKNVSEFIISKDYGKNWQIAVFAPESLEIRLRAWSNQSVHPDQQNAISFAVINDQGYLVIKPYDGGNKNQRDFIYMSSKPFDDPGFKSKDYIDIGLDKNYKPLQMPKSFSDWSWGTLYITNG
ncbi:TPA: type VI secretion system Vgr family protein, partial [Enterobacter asburiae]